MTRVSRSSRALTPAMIALACALTAPALAQAPAPAPAEPAPAATQPTAEPAPAAAAEAAPSAPSAAPRRQVRRPAPPPPRVTALSTDPQPTYGPTTVEVTRQALNRYRQIAANGGWGTLPVGGRLAVGASGPQVLALKRRLAAEGDLDPALAANPRFDAATAEAVRRFQRRVGLVASGVAAGATIRQMNVPVAVRINALERSLARLAESRFQFAPRYVIVNIPATSSESIENGVVRRRHAVIVGKPDRASPMVETRLTVVNFNPTWTIPTSIIRRDIIPKMQKNPNTLAQMRVRILDGRGNEVNPRSIDWSTERAVNFTLRQDPGAGNSLGRVRIDMPNREAVFMHDTPSRRLFLSDARFFSSGCVRVADVNDFVTWLLEPQGWTRQMVDEHMRQTDRRDVRLRQSVPVAWVYLTGWASADGTVNFRDDIYGVDQPGSQPFRVVRAMERQGPPVQIAPPVQQAAPPPPAPVQQPSGFFGLFMQGSDSQVMRD